jgi:hypothetical protein
MAEILLPCRGKRIDDSVDRFRMQLSFFPFGGRKDLVDSASRLYDAEPTQRPPTNTTSSPSTRDSLIESLEASIRSKSI